MPTNAILRDVERYLNWWREYEALSHRGRALSIALRSQLKRYEGCLPARLITYCRHLEKYRPSERFRSIVSPAPDGRCCNCGEPDSFRTHIIQQLRLYLCDGCNAILLVAP